MRGARGALSGASVIIGVDMLAGRLEVSRKMGADLVVNPADGDPVEQIMQLTGGCGVDVAIEGLGTQQTFEACLRVPSWTTSRRRTSCLPTSATGRLR